jgi:hypothetical protein
VPDLRLEDGRESDTAWLDTSFVYRKYLSIQGGQIHRLSYNSDEERIDSLLVNSLGPSLWEMNGLEVTFTRSGSLLKGISTFVSATGRYDVQVTREYRWGGTFPPAAWLPDTMASSLAGHWLFVSGYTEDKFDRQNFTADLTKPLQMVFLAVSSDSLWSWYYDVNLNAAVRHFASAHPIGGGRWVQTSTGDTVWLRVSGDTLIQSNFQGSGKRIAGYKFKHKLIRFAGAIPPPEWLATPLTKRALVLK